MTSGPSPPLAQPFMLEEGKPPPPPSPPGPQGQETMLGAGRGPWGALQPPFSPPHPGLLRLPL